MLITGAGRAFSSGADLKDLQAREDLTPEGRPDVRKALTERYHPIITTVRTMPKPVVSAVNGPCVGIGLSLALAADLVVAKESAYFLLAFVNIGLVPDGGSSLFVPDPHRDDAGHRDGDARRAHRGAAQALEWGLINRVYADEAFDGEVGASRRAPGRRPDTLLRGHQAPAQPLAVHAHGGAARARGATSSRRWPTPAISWRA